jgi:transposase
MYVRIVTSKQRHGTYKSVQIVESYRDPKKSKHPITRVIAHLGQVDKLTDRDVDNIISGVCKAIGRPTDKETALECAWDFGHVFALIEIWKELKVATILKQKADRSAQSFDLEAHIRLMVINRLCDPRSKLAVLEWLQGVYLPGLDREKIDYHHLLRAMDWLIEHKQEIELKIANRLVTLFDQEVDLVFYDITSTYFEGDQSITAEDIRRYGYSRDHRPDRRQVVIGVVMSRDGMPFCHHVFSGSTADKSTVVDVVGDLKGRFGFDRVIFVGDRGMLSEENLEFVLAEKLDFIVCHRLRRNNQIKSFVTDTHEALTHDPQAKEQYLEDRREGVKFVMAYDPQMASVLKKRRQEALAKADAFIRDIQARLRRVREPRSRPRRLTPEGAWGQLRDYLKSHNLLRYYRIELDSDHGLRVTSDTHTRQWEKLIDGKLIVETTQLDMPAQEVIARYKELQIVERGFQCLKSSLKLRPVYHWTERRIRAHVFICVLALQVERAMTLRLHGLKISTQTALEKLRQIKAGHARVNSVKTPVITTLTEEQKTIYRQLNLPFPKITQLQRL